MFYGIHRRGMAKAGILLQLVMTLRIGSRETERIEKFCRQPTWSFDYVFS